MSKPEVMSKKGLQGRIALVTGASKGLGKAMALELARQGAAVALVARDEVKLNEAATEIRDAGGRAEVFIVDVTSEADFARLDVEVTARLGKIQILVNNAGMNLRKNITDFTLEEWNLVVNTNLTSVFLACRQFVPHMQGTGYGRILNLISMMAHVSLPQRTAYSSTKSALIGLTKALALELAAEGITVNGISPGPIVTELNAPILQNPELNATFISKIPVGRWGQPSEIGSLAAFLCSDEAGFITGTDILIDGGWCAQ